MGFPVAVIVAGILNQKGVGMRRIIVILLAVLMVMAVSCNGEMNVGGSGNENSGTNTNSGSDTGTSSGSNSGNESGNETAKPIDPAYVGTWTETGENGIAVIMRITEDGHVDYITIRKGFQAFSGTVSFDEKFMTLSICYNYNETSYLFIQDGTKPGTKKIALYYDPTPDSDSIDSIMKEYTVAGNTYTYTHTDSTTQDGKTRVEVDKQVISISGDKIVCEYDWKVLEDGVLVEREQMSKTYRCTEGSQGSSYQYELSSLGITDTYTGPFTCTAGVLCCGAGVFSKETGESNSGCFEISSNGILTAKKGATLPSTLIIPSTVNGIEVKKIGRGAFSRNEDISYVISPDTVTAIQTDAFYDCINLKAVIIPASVTTITTAFGNCENLTDLIIDGNNTVYSAENGILYDKTKTILYAWPSAKGAVVIPDTVTEIKGSAFEWNNNTTSFTIPSSVTTLSISPSIFPLGGNYTIEVSPGGHYCIFNDALYNNNKNALFKAFGGSGAITLPDTLEVIGKYAFFALDEITSVTISSAAWLSSCSFCWCQGLTEITVMNSGIYLSAEVFFGCENLETINYSGTKEQWNTMKKNEKWNRGMPSCTVHCTDGDLVVEPIQ